MGRAAGQVRGGSGVAVQSSRRKILLSWSTGKDSAGSLHILRQAGDFEVVGLLTTINEEFRRVAISGVREELLDAQAEAAELPLRKHLPDLPLIETAQFLLATSPAAYRRTAHLCPGCEVNPLRSYRRRKRP